MKTLVKNNTSLYVFEDSEALTITSDHIIVGNPVKFTIADCNSGNTEVFEQVTPPADWTGHKYFFDGTTWTENPDWVDPATLEDTTND